MSPNTDTTLDSKLVGRMIHVDCNRHHCNEQHSAGTSHPQPPSISNPLNRDVPAPEYLHCGFWPRPLTEADVDEESHEPRGLHDHHDLGMGRSGPTRSTSSLRPEEPRSAAEDEGSDSFNNEDEPEPIHKSADHHSVVTDEFSKVVDAWRLELQGSQLGEDRNSDQAKKPYSVLRLFARQNATHRKNGNTDDPPAVRQGLFDQEIAAECRARSETMEYIDALVDEGEFQDAYACIWPLEEYRRNGWAEEMIFAFPKECWQFVDMVRERQKAM